MTLRAKIPPQSAEQAVVCKVHGEVHEPAWKWPERARARLSLYLSVGKFDEVQYDHCVRGILSILRGSKSASQ